MIHRFFLYPSPFFLFTLSPSLQPSPRHVTGSLPRLVADSALCPPSGSPIIVLRVDIGHWQAVGRLAAGEWVGGRGRHQEDGWLSNRQSENSGRSSFHPFVWLTGSVLVCEDEIQSSSFHSLFFSPLHIAPPFLFSASILLEPTLPFFSIFFCLSFFSTVASATYTKDSPPFCLPRA